MGSFPAGPAGATVPLEVEGNSSAPASATTRHPPTAAPTVLNPWQRSGPARPGLPGDGGAFAAVTAPRSGPGPAPPHLWRDNLTVLDRAWRRETVILMLVGTAKQSWSWSVMSVVFLFSDSPIECLIRQEMISEAHAHSTPYTGAVLW